MTIIHLLIVPFVLLSLFLVFSLSRQDFVILRKNITLPKIFDEVFKSFFIGVIVARLIHIINSGEYFLFNPLAFFHFFVHPGFSILGFYMGFVLSIVFFFRKTKIVSRFLDIIMISVFPLLILHSFFVTYFNNRYIDVGISLLLVILFFIFLRIGKNYKLRDGNVGFIIIMCISLFIFLSRFGSENVFITFFSLVQWMAIGGFIAASGFLTVSRLQKRR